MSFLKTFVRRAGLALAGGTLLAATSASAYVVVTIDNQVYEVASKPEVRGEMVYFTLDGVPVSLRVYDVNITKTNEFNYLVDRGGDMVQIVERAKTLRPAQPTDERVIVSSELHTQAYEYRTHHSPEARTAHFHSKPAYSFSSDTPGPRKSTAQVESASAKDAEFESEARQALADAKRKVRQESEPADASTTASSRGDYDADSDRVAELDSQIQAEQEYLKKLTNGETEVDDLDREIEKSMDKIKRLQEKRAKASGGSDSKRSTSARDEADEPAYSFSGKHAAGSRGAHMEQELQQAMDKLGRLKTQQAALPADAGDEREVTDELIGETQYRIDKLKKKLGRLED